MPNVDGSLLGASRSTYNRSTLGSPTDSGCAHESNGSVTTASAGNGHASMQASAVPIDPSNSPSPTRPWTDSLAPDDDDHGTHAAYWRQHLDIEDNMTISVHQDACFPGEHIPTPSYPAACCRCLMGLPQGTSAQARGVYSSAGLWGMRQESASSAGSLLIDRHREDDSATGVDVYGQEDSPFLQHRSVESERGSERGQLLGDAESRQVNDEIEFVIEEDSDEDAPTVASPTEARRRKSCGEELEVMRDEQQRREDLALA